MDGKDGWMDGWMDIESEKENMSCWSTLDTCGWMDGWMDGWIDGEREAVRKDR